MPKNSCYTYFNIIGSFDPDKITLFLELTPDKTVKEGDTLRSGRVANFSSWVFGGCVEYDVYTENQMRATIAPLLDKIDKLNQIREKCDVEFYLAIVPTVHSDEPTPCLAPPMDVIDFCHTTRTKIDIDLYVE